VDNSPPLYPPLAWGYHPPLLGIPPPYTSKCQNRGDNTLDYAKKIFGKIGTILGIYKLWII